MRKPHVAIASGVVDYLKFIFNCSASITASSTLYPGFRFDEIRNGICLIYAIFDSVIRVLNC